VTPMSIWHLRPGGRGNLGITSARLDYFRDHFVGHPMAHDWSPPPFELSGKSKRVRDFLSWELTAPLVSEKAKSALEPLCTGHAEFLPFATIKRVQFFALNVLTSLNILDEGASDLDRFNGALTALRKARFKHPLPVELPPVFKLPQWSSVYVTKSFVDVVIGAKLHGLSLADPGQDNFQLVVRGLSTNVVSGVQE
jgi:hypothetical protein